METLTTCRRGELRVGEIKQNFATGPSDAFEMLYRQVNRQALAPFFRSYLNTNDAVLDAGCGQGNLAIQLKLPLACCTNLVFEQLRQDRRLDVIGKGGL
jgi:hypothetical protein